MKSSYYTAIKEVTSLIIKKKLLTKSAVAISIFLAGVSIGVLWEENVGIGTWHTYHLDTNKLKVCFTPPSGCGDLIANEIVKAKHSIYVQAYGLTSRSIIHQLISAHKRGVKVKVLLDGGNLSRNKKIVLELQKEGIEVSIDKISNGIAHNKVIIIDSIKVITGSFNFTAAADTKNAENVLLIEDKQIAKIYFINWQNRKKKSVLRL